MSDKFQFQTVFVPRALIRAEEFNALAQAIDSALDLVDVALAKTFQFAGGAAEGLDQIAPADLAFKVVGFNENGELSVRNGFQFVGDYVSAQTYTANSLIRDPISKNLYFATVDFESTSIASDIASGNLDLAIDVSEVEAFKDLAEAAAANAAASASSALISKNNAEVSAASSLQSANNSAASAAAALASETNAAASAAAALLSETNAAASAAAALLSETNAAASAAEAADLIANFEAGNGGSVDQAALDQAVADAEAAAAAALASETNAAASAANALASETNAAASATNALTSETNAAASAAEALASETNAAASAAAALASETNAAASAANALTSESNAAASAAAALASETNAAASAAAALASETAAAQLFEDFSSRYLGSFANDPMVDGLGNPLIDGALYFNTTDNILKVYDLGNALWLALGDALGIVGGGAGGGGATLPVGSLITAPELTPTPEGFLRLIRGQELLVDETNTPELFNILPAPPEFVETLDFSITYNPDFSTLPGVAATGGAGAIFDNFLTYRYIFRDEVAPNNADAIYVYKRPIQDPVTGEFAQYFRLDKNDINAFAFEPFAFANDREGSAFTLWALNVDLNGGAYYTFFDDGITFQGLGQEVFNFPAEPNFSNEAPRRLFLGDNGLTLVVIKDSKLYSFRFNVNTSEFDVIEDGTNPVVANHFVNSNANGGVLAFSHSADGDVLVLITSDFELGDPTKRIFAVRVDLRSGLVLDSTLLVEAPSANLANFVTDVAASDDGLYIVLGGGLNTEVGSDQNNIGQRAVIYKHNGLTYDRFDILIDPNGANNLEDSDSVGISADGSKVFTSFSEVEAWILDPVNMIYELDLDLSQQYGANGPFASIEYYPSINRLMVNQDVFLEPIQNLFRTYPDPMLPLGFVGFVKI